MLIHAKMEHSTVNGPGARAVIWFQGCTLNCSGCWNPNTHKFSADSFVHDSELFTWIQGLSDVEGLTFSGGEPMQHWADVLSIAQYVKDVRPELSLGMFTGYTARELETGNFHTLHPIGGVLVPGAAELWDKLRPMLDWAVMGRFNASKMTTTKPLCGSSNQDIVLFSDRYTAADFKPQAVNVTIGANGVVQITGFPSSELLAGLTKL